MSLVQSNTPHSVLTTRRGLVYVFTPKHHGASYRSACWNSDISLEEEFVIFDVADGIIAPPGVDNRQVADQSGNLYGHQVAPQGSLRQLGIWHEQLAEFPHQQDGDSWHGYPVWPILPPAPDNLLGQRCRPDSVVFDRMVELGIITNTQSRRLKKGDWI
jgi:hypothetical protein